MSQNSTESPKYPINSVGNALRLMLELRSQDRLTVTSAAELLSVAPSTAHRTLAMLEYHGFVSKDDSHGYQLGPALLGMGLAALHNLDLRKAARPHLEFLAAQVQETVNLIVMEGLSVRFIDCVESPKALRVTSRIGLRRPATTTSVGKAILACLPQNELDALYPPEEALPVLTEHSLPDRSQLDAELEIVKRSGYATNVGESDDEIRAIGVAIRDQVGRPLGGLAVSAPSNRLLETRLPEVAKEAMEVAEAIERDLGI